MHTELDHLTFRTIKLIKMKTYTLEQFKKYLSKQDSMGDIMYNLSKIDDYLVNDEIILIESTDELHDFLVDLEYHQNEKFEWREVVYEITDEVTDFIREYRYESFTEIRTNLEELLENGLIKRI
jgi:hypothetical protein